MLNRQVEREGEVDVAAVMAGIGARARAAARTMALATTETKDAALTAVAAELRSGAEAILTANADDLAAMEDSTGAYRDRAALTPARLEAVAQSVEAIAALEDPIGTVIAAWQRPNGLKIERVRTPLGVVGIIYESRPNVTADAGALALKAGNVAILRGGSDTFRTNAAIHGAMMRGLVRAGLPGDAILFVPTKDRAAVGEMLAGLAGAIDVIVPRGGKSLVSRVQAEARVPVFAHLEGIVHVYVHAAANLAMARDVVFNAKMRRTGICGAAETLLVDRAVADTHLRPVLDDLDAAGCTIRGDDAVRKLWPKANEASAEDWSSEYLDAILAVKIVDGLEDAIEHVETYGSHHTEAIVTDDPDAAERFLNGIDSAIVIHNASTQFADGGEFGMGAEIGIATGKMHARGPVGVEQLTSFKYRVRGSGQTRP